MAEFTINGKSYRTRPLNAIQQFHVARRLAPLLAEATNVFQAGQNEDVQSLDQMADIMKPIFDVLSQMKDDELDYIMERCLSVTQRQQAGGQYAPMWNVAARQPQFADLSMVELLQITFQVIQENLGNFFQNPSSISPGLPSQPNGPSNGSPFPTVSTS